MKAASACDPFADYGGWLSIRQLARPTLLLALGVPVIYASTATHYPQIRSRDGTCKSPLEHVPDPADFDVQFQEGIDMPEDGETTKVDAKPDFQTAVRELKDIARRQLRGAEIMYEIRDKNRERIEKARRHFSALGGDASAHHRELLGQLLANEEEKAVTYYISHKQESCQLPKCCALGQNWGYAWQS
jgi:hypothetical protein